MRLHLVATLGILLLALLVLGVEASASPFEADEADYVATSRYFGYLVLQHDVTRKEWGSNHWTRTQPPLTRYIVGAWLTAWGYDLERLNQPYVSTASSFEVNRQKGRVPTDDVLARSRQPMVLLGAGAIALLYPLGLVLGGALVGPIAGGLTALLALSSPFMRYTLVHTWAEAPLAFFLLLAALVAAVGMRRAIGRQPRTWIWAVGLGLALGLAAATKLTGLVGLVPLSGAAGMLMLLHWRRQRDLGAIRAMAAWTALATALTVTVFVVVNPYLWPDPVGGLGGMLAERRDEMAFQQDQWPEYAVTGWAERPWLTISGSLQVGPLAEVSADTLPPVLMSLPLLLIGLLVLYRRGRWGQLDEVATSLLVWAACYAAMIVAGLGLKYPRYFMPSTLRLLPIVGFGAAVMLRAIWMRLPLPRSLSRQGVHPRPT
jgi:4-amino-4-deoxy-L-arabinose transferase-like glycosyltransferase